MVNDHKLLTILTIGKVLISIMNSFLLTGISLNRSKRKSKILRKLYKKLLFFMPFLIMISETMIFINLEIRYLNTTNQCSLIFFRALAFFSKLFTINGSFIKFKFSKIALFLFFVFTNTITIYVIDDYHTGWEISICILNCFQIFFNFTFLKLINSRRKNKEKQCYLFHGIYEELFLKESNPMFIISTEDNQNFKLFTINEKTKTILDIQNEIGKIKYKEINENFKKKMMGFAQKDEYSNSTTLVSHAIVKERESLSKKIELKTLVSEFYFCNKKTKKFEIYLENSKTRENDHYEFEILKINYGQKIYYAFLIHNLEKKDEVKNLKNLNEINNRLFCSLSHELKTPINGALPSLQMVRSALMEEELIKLLDISIGSLKLLDNSLNNVLDFYLFQTDQMLLNKTEFSFQDLILEIREIIFPMIEVKNIKFTLEISNSAREIKIKSDYVKLKQILLNLVTNAIQFTFKGGIVLKIDQVQKDSNQFIISIIDTGIGIEDEKLAKILKKIKEPNQERLEINKTGSCMGLMISEKISSLLGSEEGLFIESQHGKGSIFSFTINFDFTIYETIKDVMNIQPASSKIINQMNIKLKTNTMIKNSLILDEKRQICLSQNKKKNRCSIQIQHPHYLFSKSLDEKKSNKLEKTKTYTNKSKNLEDDSISNLELGFDQKIHGYQFENSPKFIKGNKQLEESKLGNKNEVPSGLSDEILHKFQSDASLTNTVSVKISSKPIKISFDNSITLNRKKACECEEILCVDDDAFNLLSLEIMLKYFNLKCVKVMNGIAALEELLKKRNCHNSTCPKFKLIFMDYQMPLMDGVQTTEKIMELIEKNELTESVVIGCTAFVSKDEILNCYSAGMKEVIFKPLNKNIIKSILLEWLRF